MREAGAHEVEELASDGPRSSMADESWHPLAENGDIGIGCMPCSPRERVRVEDSVEIDAKRILLRYGMPIAVLDKTTEEERIRLAHTIVRTALADREVRLRDLLLETGTLVG